jgi:uroporphyrin-III C-methyltransferase
MQGTESDGLQGGGRGKIVLVGAGPGDPGLLTIRAAEVLETCDVVLYDALVNSAILELARPGALLVSTGKRGGGPSMRQAEIDALAIAHARRGRTVVRLKGGDPFVFGRGAEEIEAYERAGIRWDVVAGVSSGTAGALAAGIPLTRRSVASSVTFVTAEEANGAGRSNVDWQALARGSGTIVVFMCARHPAAVAVRLVDGGRSPSTPVALVSRATLPDQSVRYTTLGALAGADSLSVPSPAIAIVGDVAAFPLRTGASRRREVGNVQHVA